jgi:Flp pilus assembly protein TadD
VRLYIKMANSNKSTMEADVRDLANAYSLLASVLDEMGRFKEALVADKQALELMSSVPASF